MSVADGEPDIISFPKCAASCAQRVVDRFVFLTTGAGAYQIKFGMSDF